MATTGSVGSDYYIPNGGINSHSVIQGKDATEMNMDDFFSLLVAQMTNQDMMNPSNDTEYISQMAQFTTLRGMQVIQEYQLSSYATSYVGKTVAIAHTGEGGNLTKTEGVVDSVTFYDGEPKVVVNGVSYPLYSVMEVKVPGSASSGGESSGITQAEAAAYIGKTVTVRFEDEDEEEMEVKGVVTSVNTNDKGIVQVVIDGNEYPASGIVSVA